MKIKILLTLLTLALQIPSLVAATISVKIDRNQVSMNESFQLTFEVEGDVEGDPDFSPLEEKFQILSTSQNSNFSMINGRILSSKQWTVTVLADAPGLQTIPSISFGNDKSQVIQVDIKDVNTDGDVGQQQSDIYLEAFATPLDPYVQSQVIYTLKLYRSVSIAKASLTDPEIISGDAVIERISDDRNYRTSINEIDYQVTERSYAVYPQSSGEVTIAPINFMGQVSRGRFGLDPFSAPPKTVVRRSQSVAIGVRKIPDSYDGSHWLPAENISIIEEWSGDPLTLRVGEPITRTLVLTTKGLISSQLPELPLWNLPDLKFYPDRPQLNDEKNNMGITSSRREKAAIIPNRPGSFVLPEISIPWWNTQTDVLEYALVPERRIEVLPAINADIDLKNTINGVVQPASEAVKAEEQNDIKVDDNASTLLVNATTDTWKWATLVLMLAWLITLVAWRQHSKKLGSHQSFVDNGAKPEKLSSLVQSILSACDSDNPIKTKTSFIAWSKCVWPDNPPIGINEIAKRTSPALASELIKLNERLYSKKTGKWIGKNLRKVFLDEVTLLSSKKSKQVVTHGKLEPLFRI